MRGFHTVVKLVCHAIHSFFAFVFTKVTCVFSTQLLWWGQGAIQFSIFHHFSLGMGEPNVAGMLRIIILGKTYPCDQAYFLREIQIINGQFQNMTD